MSNNEFDVLVIGSGPGGYVCAIRAAQLGLKTACVEKMATLGGTCLNVGCIPSKALLHTTEYYEWFEKEGKSQGITGNLSVDFDQMMKRKQSVVKGLVDGVASLFKKHNITRINGTACFKNLSTVEVNGQSIIAKNVVLATGSDPIPLPFLPFDEKIVVSSTGVLGLKKIPKKMVVVGAGVIGVELASVYRRLGSEVVIVEMLDKITPAMDNSVSKSLLQILKKQGLSFHLSSKVQSGSVQNDIVNLKIEGAEGVAELSADVVLVAVGRRPYSQGLGLETIGIEKDKKGFVAVDGNFRTSKQNIYAIGDLVDGPMLAHRASEEGIAVAEIIAGQKPHINYMAIPNVIYTHPEVAAVGMTESEAKEAGLSVKTGTCFFKGNARARCSGYTEGFVKVIGETNSGRLLGMHIIGPHASEMIGEGVMAIVNKMSIEQIASSSHAHPTLSEAIMDSCLNFLGRPINQ